VVRDARGRIAAGSAPINPGGLTPELRAARDALTKLFALPGEVGLYDDGIAAYRRCLKADNGVIVKDFMDRLLGKVKERVEVSDDPDAPLLGGWSLNDVLAALAAAREKK
jgi:hypothetical protein